MGFHRREFDVRKIGTDATASEAKTAIGNGDGATAVTLRATQHPLHPTQVAVVMWQVPGSEIKWYVDVFDYGVESEEEVRALIVKLLECPVKTTNLAFLRAALKNRYGNMPGVNEGDEKLPKARSLLLDALAGRLKVRLCPATRMSPIWREDDVTDAVIYHLAWETDIL